MALAEGFLLEVDSSGAVMSDFRWPWQEPPLKLNITANCGAWNWPRTQD
jgi:hypothetical protein